MRINREYFPERVADFERRTGKEFDLIKHPEQVLDGWISFCVMTVGMHKGTFREGHTLDRYFNPKVCDPFGARAIVNGDKNYKIKGSNVKIGDRIASDTKKFELVLRSALVKELTADNVSDAIDTLRANAVSPNSADADSVYPTDSLPQNPLEDSAAGAHDFAPDADLQSDSADHSRAEPPLPDTGEQTEVISKKETPTADGGTATLEVKTEKPPGDSPEKPARWTFNVEDWKPWVFEKLKLTWKGWGGLNLGQGAATVYAAYQAGENWIVPVAIFAAGFILSLIVCAFISLILLAVWYFNRREIKDYKTAELQTRSNPNLFNFGLNIEKI